MPSVHSKPTNNSVKITLKNTLDGNEIIFSAEIAGLHQVISYKRAFRDACSLLQSLLRTSKKTGKVEGQFDMRDLNKVCIHRGEFEYALFLKMTQYFIQATGHTITRFGFPLGDDGEPVSEDTLYIHFTK